VADGIALASNQSKLFANLAGGAVDSSIRSAALFLHPKVDKNKARVKI
jgi:hypothetical protein